MDLAEIDSFLQEGGNTTAAQTKKGPHLLIKGQH